MTDRTSIDDLAYAILHCRDVVDAAFIDRAFTHADTYGAIFFCPVATFCDLAGDPARVSDPVYHQVYDALVQGLLQQYIARPTSRPVVRLDNASPAWRLAMIRIRMTFALPRP